MLVFCRVRPFPLSLWSIALLVTSSCGPARSTPAASPASPQDSILYSASSEGGALAMGFVSDEGPGSSVTPGLTSAGNGAAIDAAPLGTNTMADGGGLALGPSTMQDDSTAEETTRADQGDGPCPTGMLLVDGIFCPRIERQCLDEEYSPQNHFTICHRFATSQRCLVPEEHRRFCIDAYEYPNRRGAHPPWMVSWYDAQATCASLDKRLCYESEWVSACEGPDKTPFPYGYERDNTKCNIDNTWIQPHLSELYGKDSEARDRELARLDQSVRSGELSECVSGYGVHDLTGNFDEWVTSDHRYDDRSEWAALKGGAWGHVRNACRPTTTSHPPDFTYYFIGFRCCKDAPDSEPYAPKADRHRPAVEPKDRAPIPEPVDPPGPSPIKAPRERWPKPVAGR